MHGIIKPMVAFLAGGVKRLVLRLKAPIHPYPKKVPTFYANFRSTGLLWDCRLFLARLLRREEQLAAGCQGYCYQDAR